MRQEACCTCAALLAAVPRASCSSEKPLPDDRLLDCCGRIVCSDCTLVRRLPAASIPLSQRPKLMRAVSRSETRAS